MFWKTRETPQTKSRKINVITTCSESRSSNTSSGVNTVSYSPIPKPNLHDPNTTTFRNLLLTIFTPGLQHLIRDTQKKFSFDIIINLIIVNVRCPQYELLKHFCSEACNVLQKYLQIVF